MDRTSRVRRATRSRQTIVALTVIALALSIIGVAAFAKAPAASGPDKVWVCHFPGHDAGTTWSGGGAALDGDYVVAYRPGMPAAGQIAYCEDGVGTSPGGGNLILISVNALDGHGAQLQGRVADYPDGYRG